MNIPISRRLPPLFDDDGVISFDTAIHHKKTPIYIASILVLLSFIFFGKECFISLLSIGLFLNLVTTFNEKQPQKKLEANNVYKLYKFFVNDLILCDRRTKYC